MMPVASPSEAIAIESPSRVCPATTGATQAARFHAPTMWFAPAIAIRWSSSCRTRRFTRSAVCPSRARSISGRTRPTGLAYSPERGLLAVSTRSGSIHLIELTLAK